MSRKTNALLFTRTYSPYGYRPFTVCQDPLLAFGGGFYDSATEGYPLGNGRRVFSPVRMRFNSPDALSPFAQGGLNSYVYCAGDPINFNDPSGQFRLPAALRTLAGAKPLKTVVSLLLPAKRASRKKFNSGQGSAWFAQVKKLSKVTRNFKPEEFDHYFETRYPEETQLRDAVSATNAARVAATPPGGLTIFSPTKRMVGSDGRRGKVLESNHFRGMTYDHAAEVKSNMMHWETLGGDWFARYSKSELPTLLDEFQAIRGTHL
jgi:RHS repeat-associated protein